MKTFLHIIETDLVSKGIVVKSKAAIFFPYRGLKFVLIVKSDFVMVVLPNTPNGTLHCA